MNASFSAFHPGTQLLFPPICYSWINSDTKNAVNNTKQHRRKQIIPGFSTAVRKPAPRGTGSGPGANRIHLHRIHKSTIPVTTIPKMTANSRTVTFSIRNGFFIIITYMARLPNRFKII